MQKKKKKRIFTDKTGNVKISLIYIAKHGYELCKNRHTYMVTDNPLHVIRILSPFC